MAAIAAILIVSHCSEPPSASGKSLSSPPSLTTESAVVGSRQSLARPIAALLTVLSVAALTTASVCSSRSPKLRTERRRGRRLELETVLREEGSIEGRLARAAEQSRKVSKEEEDPIRSLREATMSVRLPSVSSIPELPSIQGDITCAKTPAASLRSSSPLPLSANTSTTKRAPRASRNCLIPSRTQQILPRARRPATRTCTSDDDAAQSASSRRTAPARTRRRQRALPSKARLVRVER